MMGSPRYPQDTNAALMPSEIEQGPQIRAAVAQALAEFSPDVEKINYRFGQDWTGDWVVFFQVLLSDAASREPNLAEILPRIVRSITSKIIPNVGLFPHFNFRSHSEQALLMDPDWE